MVEPYDRDPDYVTIVFEKNIRTISDNPFSIDTPFGKPVAIGIGNAFDEIEYLHDIFPENLSYVAELRPLAKGKR